jgi:hypothetical protein
LASPFLFRQTKFSNCQTNHYTSLLEVNRRSRRGSR